MVAIYALYNVEFTMECSIRLAVSLSEEDLRAFPGDQLHFRCHHTFSNFFVIIIIVVIITLSSELLLMPVNGTFHLVSADKGQGRQAAATEIWNLRSAQDNSRHQLRPTQDAQLWHWKWNSVQSKDKEVNKCKIIKATCWWTSEFKLEFIGREVATR